MSLELLLGKLLATAGGHACHDVVMELAISRLSIGIQCVAGIDAELLGTLMNRTVR